MNQNQFYPSDYAVGAPLNAVFPLPIIGKRAPLTSDKAQLGRLWVYPATNGLWILSSIANNASTWTSLMSGGGAGSFSSLTVDPGPVTFMPTGSGDFNVGNYLTYGGQIQFQTNSSGQIFFNTNGGSLELQSVSGQLGIFGGTGTGLGNTAGLWLSCANTGDIQIGSPGHSGEIFIGVGLGDETVTICGNPFAGMATQTVNIATNSGVTNLINIGSSSATSVTTISSPILALPGPVHIYTGAGSPGAGLAVNAGDLYVNTTPSGATDRMFIATGAGTWTNFTTAA